MTRQQQNLYLLCNLTEQFTGYREPWRIRVHQLVVKDHKMPFVFRKQFRESEARQESQLFLSSEREVLRRCLPIAFGHQGLSVEISTKLDSTVSSGGQL